ncbi:hemolysin family protein [Parabacteroides sp. PF5-9]|uniref:hemolysin family protein n=1 Tax=Parabacteroides sp. PF5-9 TaxID=1742404 RepID=UPI002473441C|nr:hemolysin family protein [Parabacteroides sp. PF5-9]
MVLYFVLAIGVSFLCSIMEAVLLSTPVSYVNMRVESGDKLAGLFLKLKTNSEGPITAILTLNTIAHTIGSAGVGAEAAEVFGKEYLGVISGILTFLILVFSEILPKNIGVYYWRRLIGFSAVTIQVMNIISYPVVWLSKHLTKLIAPKNKEASVSREEVSSLVKMGEQEGVFKTSENRIINNLIHFEEKKVRDIMTPRTVVVVADGDKPIKEFPTEETYSRIPIYEGPMDNIVGYVLRSDVLKCLAEDRFTDNIASIKREIMIFTEVLPVPAALEKFLTSKEHIAAIMNEYGTFEGVVTLEDVLETLLGEEILDEEDSIADLQDHARKTSVVMNRMGDHFKDE